ncbi:TPA: ATP-dependent Clp protease proteolytic subunit [candidate division WWE3 bacterium]|uniref:ATP-dependent Clp protease proteolytic subunit n=4 Tax=Bacteria candidate phyla TaxID=1783234 RepID=A0A0G1KL67_UNCKA|nr:MAG: ATP-dependent Clp protease proteolytic subunit [candidate division WWE3 bacterium GW2011_GWC2_44_9]OGC53007.1 MAG: ATP-dependent Clp protease proteolytic subunit [candidate division WWE3 bacterium RIFCSPHIGHO2_01_FULL_43_9]OGZ02124.1 MAG: ATP-dependent Clp protease proteolytic subunit [Candidatus Liptonbacteria bacterium RIFOXYB1_FULL_36_10]HAZ29521.1 ATP-dependent Clp protease proteolytic subunit [candidate division WWE3 bacterium]
MLNSVVVPIVVEKDPNGFERSYDIYSRLLKDFIVFVTGPIDLAVANTFIAQILFLESVDEKRDISVYINSPGGEAYAGRAMYDTMKYVKNDISTINVGLAASAGAMVLAGGTKGKRFALPGSYTMIHQVSGGIEGQETDIRITAQHMLKLREQYAEILAKESGQDFKKVMDDIERDNWMDAKQTLTYGLVDKIFEAQK